MLRRGGREGGRGGEGGKEEKWRGRCKTAEVQESRKGGQERQREERIILEYVLVISWSEEVME